MADRPLQVSGAEAPGWSQLNNLSCATLGSQIIFATDDWFAEAENLLVPEAAVWQEGFTEQGKWMDGWETRRKRMPGHDWCIVQLGLPGSVFGVELDTAFFTGNFAPRASVQAARSVRHCRPMVMSSLHIKTLGTGSRGSRFII